MNGALIISWGPPVRGREAKSLEVFGKALAYYEALAKQGRIHAHHEYFNLTGPAGGWMSIEGDVAELLRIQLEEDNLRLQNAASAIVEDFKVQVAAGGNDQTLQQTMTRWTEVSAELGIL